MVQSHKLKRILVTGGSSRFCEHLKKTFNGKNIFYPSKKVLNILKYENILSFVKKNRITHIIHIAGLSRPMKVHETQINSSIDLNIIGTSNIAKVAFLKSIKVIYFSTNYVYEGTKGNYKETDPVLPWNNYGWSKLGAECVVQMYKNSLIVRACMTEKPFLHKSAFSNVKSNFIFHDEFAKLFIKIINKKGVVNIGGKRRTIYLFAKQHNKNIKKIKSTGQLPKKMDMNLAKFKKLAR